MATSMKSILLLVYSVVGLGAYVTMNNVFILGYIGAHFFTNFLQFTIKTILLAYYETKSPMARESFCE